MKKLISFLASTRLMAVLFIVFSIAMGVATFIENDYNTDTAKILIYNAKWFEAIMLVFLINFLFNIKRYQLYKREKWPTLVLHLAFIFILVGAAITRYISFEGVMPIAEGQSSNQIRSEKTYLTAWVDGDVDGQERRKTFEYPKLFSGAFDQDNFISNFGSNYFIHKEKFNQTPFTIRLKKFIMSGVESFEEDPNGDLHLKIVESDHGERHEHFLKEGSVEMIHGQLYAFNRTQEGAVEFWLENGEMYINSPFDGDYMIMKNQAGKNPMNMQPDGTVKAGEKTAFHYRSMYRLGQLQFVGDTPIRGSKVMKSNGNFKDQETADIVVVEVETEGQTQEVTLKGKKGQVGIPQSFTLGNLDFTFMFGSKIYETPFDVKLNKFIATKYPGTEQSFSSFESKVTISSPEETFDYHIYMNNILDYKGYRFFQASYFPDLSGTILSVNHDWWGTWITYIGYTLLYISMILILFLKGTRFYDLKKMLDKVRNKKANLSVVTLLLGLLSFSGFAQAPHAHNKPTSEQVEKIIIDNAIPAEQADKFGRLVVQDAGGRMKPVNTFASELIRKLSKADTYKSLNADQVFLSMTMFPQAWYHVPIINVKKENDSIRTLLGVAKGEKHIAMADFFDDRGTYKLSQFLDEAYRTQIKSQFQKDVIAADERVNLLHTALSGKILTIFPVPNDANNKWVSYPELNDSDIAKNEEAFAFAKNALPMYVSHLLKKEYEESNKWLSYLQSNQEKFGYEVLPSKDKVNSEILYNKYDIFKKLFSWYLYAAVLLFVLCIVRIFKDNFVLRIIDKIFISIIALLFILHTAGLAARWYISGHAPWSDAYESMIYVGWATMLFGLIFGRKSELTIASTAFVSGMILMVAHWNWMDPSIANLQPVLNSYWLMIHVAVIVASYGPFALGMILGVVSMILMALSTKKNKARMELTIKELTYINEMALTVGLVLLTIGNFLGGQWANESWGRYWGWDPKETWALISIMVYAFVIHMRFVPSLRGTWIYNFISVIAFYSILMTYFGVNFYLSGLHSYAKGDQVVTPSFIWWSVGLVFTLGAISFVQYRRLYKKK